MPSSPTVYVVSEWIAYEGGSVFSVLADESEALSIWCQNERHRQAARDGNVVRSSGRDVEAWVWDGARYVLDSDWPRGQFVT